MAVLASEKQELYYPEMAEIVSVETLTTQEKKFSIQLRENKSLNHTPGQFVEVSIFGFGEAPISVSSSPTKTPTFDLTIRNVGRLTDKIHRLQPGDKIGIRGPFGKGFDVKKFYGKEMLFVAGGIGLAPLKSLIDYCVDRREQFGKITILYGAKTPSEMLFERERALWTRREDIDFRTTVDIPDKNWKGNIGVITTLIPSLELDLENTICSIVGPPIMYKFVLMALKGIHFPDENIYMSLERRMKCGVGKCGHCQINHSYVCQDGPVYHYPLAKKLEEAL